MESAGVPKGGEQPPALPKSETEGNPEENTLANEIVAAKFAARFDQYIDEHGRPDTYQVDKVEHPCLTDVDRALALQTLRVKLAEELESTLENEDEKTAAEALVSLEQATLWRVHEHREMQGTDDDPLVKYVLAA